MEKELLISDVSECLNTSRQSIMKWLDNGKFPNARKDKKTGWWAIPISDVEKIRQQMIAAYQSEIEAISKHPSHWTE